MNVSHLNRLLPPPGITQSKIWATVTQESPLRIQLDGEPGPLPITPDTLVAGLEVNDRVYVAMTTNNDPLFAGRRVVVLGKAGGLSASQATDLYGGTSDETLAIGNHTHDETGWPKLYVCTSQLDLTTTTMTNVPNFSFPVETGWSYYAVALVSYTGPTGADVKFDWSRSDGIENTDIRRFIIGLAAGTTTNMDSNILMPRRDGDTDQVVGADGGTGSGATTYLEHVVIIPSADGTVGLRAAQSSATGTTSISVASRLFVQRAWLN